MQGGEIVVYPPRCGLDCSNSPCVFARLSVVNFARLKKSTVVVNAKRCSLELPRGKVRTKLHATAVTMFALLLCRRFLRKDPSHRGERPRPSAPRVTGSPPTTNSPRRRRVIFPADHPLAQGNLNFRRWCDSLSGVGANVIRRWCDLRRGLFRFVNFAPGIWSTDRSVDLVVCFDFCSCRLGQFVCCN